MRLKIIFKVVQFVYNIVANCCRWTGSGDLWGRWRSAMLDLFHREMSDWVQATRLEVVILTSCHISDVASSCGVPRKWQSANKSL